MPQSVIFVSYSHKDEREKEKLLTHLGVLQREGFVDLWSDDCIGAGADWVSEIDEAMAQARVAILIITANFLTSDFILGQEIPTLLKRRQSEGLTVFPVIAKACAWQEVDWLVEMKVRPKNGRAIWGAGSRQVNEDLTAIAKEVAAIVKATSAEKSKGTLKKLENLDIDGGPQKVSPLQDLEKQIARKLFVFLEDKRVLYVSYEREELGYSQKSILNIRERLIKDLEQLADHPPSILTHSMKEMAAACREFMNKTQNIRGDQAMVAFFHHDHNKDVIVFFSALDRLRTIFRKNIATISTELEIEIPDLLSDKANRSNLELAKKVIASFKKKRGKRRSNL